MNAKNSKKNLVIGILAHVDAGKTTLSEALLFACGAIKKFGRVDHRDSFLDTDAQERERGITIFAKQALFETESANWTLLDTPGHVDFSAEMERTLRVLDLSITIVDARTGVTDHSLALWELQQAYKLPGIIWINKMDLQAVDYEALYKNIRDSFGDCCIDMNLSREELYEEIALQDERLLAELLETGKISDASMALAIKERKFYPCFFGSALKQDGIDQLTRMLELVAGSDAFVSGGHAERRTEQRADDQGADQSPAKTGSTDQSPAQSTAETGNTFGAIVYKISRDEKGNRLSHMKLTSGTLKPKDVILTGEEAEKVNQIRVYNGGKAHNIDEAVPGMVVAVSGLEDTYAGQSLGIEPAGRLSALEIGRLCKLSYPAGTNEFKFIRQLAELEEELPELQLYVEESEYEASSEGSESGKLVLLRIMGTVQNEVIVSILRDRFGVNAVIADYVPVEIEIPEEEDEEEEVDDRPDLNARWLSSGNAGGPGAGDDEELRRIFERTYGRQPKKLYKSAEVLETAKTSKKKEPLAEYLLVDGYNIIYAWDDLKELANTNIGSARDALIDMLCNYRSWTSAEIVLVFDAYKIKGGHRKTERHGNIYVVYTEEAESADTYIEKLSYGMKKRYKVKVATSDYAEQIIALGNNAQPIWASDFRMEIDRVNQEISDWIKKHNIRAELESKNRIELGASKGKATDDTGFDE